INGDGNPDVLARNATGSVVVIWEIVNGQITATHALPGWDDWPLQGFFDINGDGHQEALFQNANGMQDALAIGTNFSWSASNGTYTSGKVANAVGTVPGAGG